MARPAVPPAPSGPARWLYTDRVGVIFDPSLPAPTLPGAEPALLDGVRAMVSNGLLGGWARSGERLSGFRRLPARFGGGYAFWSGSRTYRADTFLGELTVLADVGATGGIRPWMGALLLRTSAGAMLLDPATKALRRAPYPDLADGVATGDLRAARLDGLGRASVTADGGATWTDVLASRGVRISGLTERQSDVALDVVERAGDQVVLDGTGVLSEVETPPSVAQRVNRSPGPPDFPTSPRALPDEALARVAVAGAELPGGLWLVAREGGLQIYAAATALPLDDADLLDVDEKLARCQPITAGSSTVLLACAGEGGAEVLSLGGALGRPRLEMTFPEQGLFVSGPRDRLGFVGRCGPAPPSATDLGVGAPHREEMPYGMGYGKGSDAPDLVEPRVEASLPDDARYCARISADRWIERRLAGAPARALYRFVPGPEGRVTALVLGGDNASPEGPLPARADAAIGEGVRVIHLDPDDPSLGGGAYPAVLAASPEAHQHPIDADFWEDDDGAIRGWVRLPPAGEATLGVVTTPQGPARRPLRVALDRGQRAAGVRIDGSGHVQVSALPDGVSEVVHGGRFGLASGMSEGVALTWETVDGGRVWTRVEGPPTGTLGPPPEDASPHGCSAIGCTWGAGIVRLGWGSPPPAADARPPPTALAAASTERQTWSVPAPVKLTCSVDVDAATWARAQQVPAGHANKPSPVVPRAKKPGVIPPAPAKPAAGRSPVKITPRIFAPTAASTSSPSPISLRLGLSAEIGTLAAPGRWSGEVWAPFQPAGSVQHLSATDLSLNTVHGGVIPLLSASPREPVELLLSIGKRRLRAGSGSPSFAALDVPARITVAADGPGGEVVALDADKGIVWILRGDAVSAALRLTRVTSVTPVRFTLGRRVAGGGLVVVGYSITTGEVFAGDLDLTRAEVGPLVALGAIGTLTELGAPGCVDPKGAIRFLADLSTSVAVTRQKTAHLHDQEGLGSFLIEATPERLCAAGVEVGLPGGNRSDLTVRFGRGGGAAVRTSVQAVKATCALGAAAR